MLEERTDAFHNLQTEEMTDMQGSGRGSSSSSSSNSSSSSSSSNEGLARKKRVGSEGEAILYKCRPDAWLWLPPWLRYALGKLTLMGITFTFFSIPITCIFLIPGVWRAYPVISTAWCGLIVFSMMLPPCEWPAARKIFQLWYEIFDFSCNLSPDLLAARIREGESTQFIIGMHPHGIIPLQAFLWTAYCDQYMSDLYGFGVKFCTTT